MPMMTDAEIKVYAYSAAFNKFFSEIEEEGTGKRLDEDAAIALLQQCAEANEWIEGYDYYRNPLPRDENDDEDYDDPAHYLRAIDIHAYWLEGIMRAAQGRSASRDNTVVSLPEAINTDGQAEPAQVSNGMITVPDVRIQYKGYTIQPKLDMGSYPHLNAGNSYSRGYVVVKDGCNATPGAGWYYSVIEAKAGVDCLIAANGDAQRFHELYRALCEQ